MRPINARFPQNKPAAVGACQACTTDRAAEDHDEKCRSQRIPVYLNIPAPTVDGGGVVTDPAVLSFTPDHDGDTFEIEKIFLTAEYVNQNDNLTDAEEVFRRFIKIGKKSYDCLAEDEPRGVPVLAYSQPNCCEGLNEPIPPFGNKKQDKDVLTIEFVNEQTEIVAGVVTGRAVRIRGYIKGRCSDCGYEKMCSGGSSAA